MNKSTKIRLNYLAGAAISLLLFWNIYVQVKKQLGQIGTHAYFQTGPVVFLWLCLLLMPVNLCLEAFKWQLLAGSAQKLSYKKAFSSYLAGMALSVVTPYRFGEYPGRILYLKRKNTFRLISVSILGAVAQTFAVFFFGIIGLIYFNHAFPGSLQKGALVACIVITIIIGILYWQFEALLPTLQKIKGLRRLNIYSQLLKRFDGGQQAVILSITLLRFCVYTAQYLFLLRWMNVYMPLGAGFCTVSLFFWAIAVIPSIALAELGERGQVGLYLFHHFSANTIGILSATMGIWCINLMLPAVVGSVLLFKMRLLR